MNPTDISIYLDAIRRYAPDYASIDATDHEWTNFDQAPVQCLQVYHPPRNRVLVGQTYNAFVIVIDRDSSKITNIHQVAFRKGSDRDERIPESKQETSKVDPRLFAVEETTSATGSIKKITHKLPAAYERRLVAFVDLLGFTTLVQNASHDQVSWVLVNELLLHIALECAQDNHIGTGLPFTWTQASDSLIVSCPFDPRQANIILLRLISLQLKLLKICRTLCRGGIAVGQLTHIENVFFGPAYLEALCIERTVKMPMIAVSRPLATQLLKWKGYDHLLRATPDAGTYFINYFNVHPNGGLSATGLSGVREDILAVTANTKSSKESIQEKHKWLIGYFNETVQLVPEYGVLPL